jgi:DNA-binding transcriptional ArsR family regulator
MATTPGTPRLLRAMNDRAALDLLLSQGPLSRTTLGNLTGLSKPTASQLLARLEAAGLVRARGTSAGRPGRQGRRQQRAPHPGPERPGDCRARPQGDRRRRR